jgi:hypothetical protein
MTLFDVSKTSAGFSTLDGYCALATGSHAKTIPSSAAPANTVRKRWRVERFPLIRITVTPVRGRENAVGEKQSRARFHQPRHEPCLLSMRTSPIRISRRYDYQKTFNSHT